MKNKKGQIGIEQAPAIVLIVGLLFLTMATIAFIGQKYGNALDNDYTIGSVTNETGYINNTGYTLAQASGKENFIPAIVSIRNATNNVLVSTGNYTLTGNVLTNKTAIVWSNVNITYTYTYSAQTVASNVTGDLETEIANNTSIAGIVLTISLVGIVLTILIGVFLGLRGKRI